MKKLKTPDEVAPWLHKYLKQYCTGGDMAEPARRLAVEFKTNTDGIGDACAILRGQGVLIGICKHGYYIIDSIGEWEIAMDLYYKRYISALKSYDALMVSGLDNYGEDAVAIIIKKDFNRNHKPINGITL